MCGRCILNLTLLGADHTVTRGNSYFYALIFVDSQNLYSLHLVLGQVLILNQLSASSISNL